MPVFKLNVKWGKEKFQDVECDSEEAPMLFKAQLFALSGVQPDRQKVMIKGGVLKDDEWGKLKLKDGMTLIMMGTADALPAEPADKVTFLEDMTEEQLATVLEMPPGLTNLGNTCYMNATLQCLKSVPELQQALKKFTGSLVITGGAMMPDQSITTGVRDLYEQMDKTANAVPPIIMLNVLHMCFPHFAEKNEQGVFQQQDANECWTEVVRCLQKKLPTLPPEGAAVAGEGEAAATRFFIDEYFAGEFAITMKCIEAEDEAPSYSSESFLQLSCFIEKEVKYLNTGLKNRLEEHISKHSASLGRDAQYLKSCKISRLPAYLTIQMVRFYYKEKEAVNAKILKDIKFSMTLDVFDLCTEELQQALIPAREKFKEDEDRILEERNAEKTSTENKDKTEIEKKTTKAPYWFPDKPGSNNSGYYELQAVLTHKGRSSSSGHYVGWVRRKGDDWLMFDDDRVVAVTSEDILKLSGGGDWHCAYVLLYGPRVLEIEEGREALKKANNSEETTSSVAMETDQAS